RVAELVRRAVLDLLRLRADHEMREVDVPRMRRNVGTLHHVAHVAQVALVDDVRELLSRHRLELARVGRVDEVEERRERVAQAHASAASVADVVDALHLRDDLRLVEELRVLPVERKIADTSFWPSTSALLAKYR